MEEHLSWTANLDFSERNIRLTLDRVQRDKHDADRAR
jgi:hypothetical protein